MAPVGMDRLLGLGFKKAGSTNRRGSSCGRLREQSGKVNTHKATAVLVHFSTHCGGAVAGLVVADRDGVDLSMATSPQPQDWTGTHDG